MRTGATLSIGHIRHHPGHGLSCCPTSPSASLASALSASFCPWRRPVRVVRRSLQKLLVGSTAICVALLGYWSDYRVRQSAEALLPSAWKDTSGVGCPLLPGIDARRRL